MAKKLPDFKLVTEPSTDRTAFSSELDIEDLACVIDLNPDQISALESKSKGKPISFKDVVSIFKERGEYFSLGMLVTTYVGRAVNYANQVLEISQDEMLNYQAHDPLERMTLEQVSQFTPLNEDVLLEATKRKDDDNKLKATKGKEGVMVTYKDAMDWAKAEYFQKGDFGTWAGIQTGLIARDKTHQQRRPLEEIARALSFDCPVEFEEIMDAAGQLAAAAYGKDEPERKKPDPKPCKGRGRKRQATEEPAQDEVEVISLDPEYLFPLSDHAKSTRTEGKQLSKWLRRAEDAGYIDSREHKVGVSPTYTQYEVGRALEKLQKDYPDIADDLERALDRHGNFCAKHPYEPEGEEGEEEAAAPPSPLEKKAGKAKGKTDRRGPMSEEEIRNYDYPRTRIFLSELAPVTNRRRETYDGAASKGRLPDSKKTDPDSPRYVTISQAADYHMRGLDNDNLRADSLSALRALAKHSEDLKKKR
ncbi:MAG: hypothetical protein ABIE94_02365 [archaeon]